MSDKHTLDALVFESGDLELFATASRDRNPLHLSDAEARETPYGRRVVYGILAALAAMSRLPERRSCTLAGITIDFLRPVFLEIPYTVEIDAAQGSTATVKLRDGSQVLLKAKLRFRALSPTNPGLRELGSQEAGRTEARDFPVAALTTGLRVAGQYTPSAAALKSLSARHRLGEKGIDLGAVLAMAFASYLVGMELPGRRALFSRLHFDFPEGAPAAANPLDFSAAISDVDARFDLLTMQVQLNAGEPLAQGEVRAFFRSDAPKADRRRIEALLPPSTRSQGKVALVIGGSRGLGASIALGLAVRGARVILAYQKSEAAALRVQKAAEGAAGSIELVQLDAGESGAVSALRRKILLEHQRLDFLICSASPALLNLPLEPATADRISAFIATAVSQVAVPVATFLDMLATHHGVAVVISSSAVHNPPAEWPHYVSAKAALEMLARVGSARAPFLIVRPPRLLTDLTNTPVGRDTAMATEYVSAALVRRLEAGGLAGVEFLEDFAPQPARADEVPQ